MRPHSLFARAVGAGLDALAGTQELSKGAPMCDRSREFNEKQLIKDAMIQAEQVRFMKRIRYTLLATLAVLSLARPVAGQTVEYYHLDALGSVRVVTNASGAVIERHDYLPFGEEWNPPASTPGQPLHFSGKEHDKETGLDYFGARYYAAKTARFTTVDPFLDQHAALTNPQRWNRYAYVLNNPLRNVDPDGRDTVDLAIGFVQGIGNTAVGVVTGVYTLATNPAAVGSALAQDAQLLRRGIAHPGAVLDAYVGLATSGNDADQRALGQAIGQGTGVAALILAPTAKGTAPAKPGRGLGGNPFKGKTPQEISDMLTNKGFVGKGPDPVGGQGTFLNPKTGRSVHIDANHPAPKGPHVSVQRPRNHRDLPPREYQVK
jgi:RHS repeat-associated protein